MVENCFPFVVFEHFVVHPLQPLWRGRRPKPFDEAHDQDHPAKPERLSDVQCKKGFNIALRAYALRLWLRAQTPQLRIGHILSMVNLLFCMSKTYVARRAYSEAKRAMFEEDS